MEIIGILLLFFKILKKKSKPKRQSLNLLMSYLFPSLVTVFLCRNKLQATVLWILWDFEAGSRNWLVGTKNLMQSGQLRIQVASKTALITPLMVVLFYGVFRGFGDFILTQVKT